MDGVAVAACLEAEYLVVVIVGGLGVEAQSRVGGEVGVGAESAVGRAYVVNGVVGVEGDEVGILDRVDKLCVVGAEVGVLYLVVGGLQGIACLLRGKASHHADGCAEHLVDVLLIEGELACGLYDGHQAVAQADGLVEGVVVIDVELAVGGAVGGLEGLRSVNADGVVAGVEGEAFAIGSHGEALRGVGEEACGSEVEPLVGAYVVEVVAAVALIVDDDPVGKRGGEVGGLGNDERRLAAADGGCEGAVAIHILYGVGALRADMAHIVEARVVEGLRAVVECAQCRDEEVGVGAASVVVDGADGLEGLFGEVGEVAGIVKLLLSNGLDAVEVVGTAEGDGADGELVGVVALIEAHLQILCLDGAREGHLGVVLAANEEAVEGEGPLLSVGGGVDVGVLGAPGVFVLPIDVEGGDGLLGGGLQRELVGGAFG